MKGCGVFFARTKLQTSQPSPAPNTLVGQDFLSPHNTKHHRHDSVWQGRKNVGSMHVRQRLRVKKTTQCLFQHYSVSFKLLRNYSMPISELLLVFLNYSKTIPNLVKNYSVFQKLIRNLIKTAQKLLRVNITTQCILNYSETTPCQMVVPETTKCLRPMYSV